MILKKIIKTQKLFFEDLQEEFKATSTFMCDYIPKITDELIISNAMIKKKGKGKYYLQFDTKCYGCSGFIKVIKLLDILDINNI